MLVDLDWRRRSVGGPGARVESQWSRRGRWLLLAAVVLTLLVGLLATGMGGPGLLLVVSETVATVVEIATGQATLGVRGGVPSPDGSVVVSAHTDDAGTRLVAVDAANGLERWRGEVPGDQSVRLVEWGGDVVVAGPASEASGLYLPEPRSETELTVSTRDGESRTYLVEGNLEAEALSRDGGSLFVISYLPPLAPDRYQVRRLDLTSGELVDVFTPDAHLQQAMGGTARTQAWSPDGNRLYTLYTLDDAGGSRVFVHVLAPDDLWAHCIELPKSIGSSDSLTPTLATSPDGQRLFVVDQAAGVAAQVDTQRLSVPRTTGLPDGPFPFEDVTATVTSDGRVLTGSDGTIHVLDADTLSPQASWLVPVGIVGLVEGENGQIAAVMRDRNATVLDGATGEHLRSMQLPGNGPIEAVGGTTTRVRGPQETYECAC